MLGGAALAGCFLMLLSWYRMGEIVQQQGPFRFVYSMFPVLLLISATAEVWFRSLWADQGRTSSLMGLLANSLLFGWWFTAVLGSLRGLPVSTDHGMQEVVMEALLGILLNVMRSRGASLGVLTIVSGFANYVHFTLTTADYNPRFSFVTGLLVFGPGYLLLLVLLLFLPIGRQVARGSCLVLGLLFLSMGAAALAPTAIAEKTKRPLNPNASATQRWQEDLDCLAREYPRRQLDFSRLISPADFGREIGELRASAGNRSDAEMVVRLTRLIARLGVSHSSTDWVDHPHLSYFPIQMYWCADAPVIINVESPELKELVGARVLSIGSHRPAEVQAALAPYIAHDGENWVPFQLGLFGMWADLLRFEKLTNPDGSLSLSLIKKDGKPFEAVIHPTDKTQRAIGVQYPNLASRPPAKGYWAVFKDAEPRTAYLRYTYCADVPGNPFGTFENFAARTLARIDVKQIERIIIDLRFNLGGDPHVIDPLIRGIQARPALMTEGHTYVLIGRGTFSAAVFSAAELKEKANAVLVGEPTAGCLTTYGESRWLVLPNSGLRIGYCIRRYSLGRGDMSPLGPDRFIRVPTVDELLAGTDPAFQFADRGGSVAP